MRRKSTRNASKKASPEKTATEKEQSSELTAKTRRNTRRKHRSPSKTSDSEDEIITKTKRTPLEVTPDTTMQSGSPSDDDKSKEERQWKVTPSVESAPQGEIQKLKICLKRPSPLRDSPEKTPKSRRSKSGSFTTEDDNTNSSEDKSTRRTRLRGSPSTHSNNKTEEDVEEKKGKGKSKGKHKSKIEKTSLSNETEIKTNNEISENVQVTPQSPSIDIVARKENDNKADADDSLIEQKTEIDKNVTDENEDRPCDTKQIDDIVRAEEQTEMVPQTSKNTETNIVIDQSLEKVHENNSENYANIDKSKTEENTVLEDPKSDTREPEETVQIIEKNVEQSVEPVAAKTEEEQAEKKTVDESETKEDKEKVELKKNLEGEESKQNLDEEEPKQNLEEEEPKQNLEEEKPKQNLDEEDPKQNLKEEDPKQNLKEEEPKQNFEEEEPKQNLEEEDSKQNLEENEPKQSLEGEERRQNFEEEEPKQNLIEEEPKQNLEEKEPKQNLKGEEPKQNFEDEEPKQNLKEEEPKQNFEEEEPKKNFEEEEPKQQLDEEEPMDVDTSAEFNLSAPVLYQEETKQDSENIEKVDDIKETSTKQTEEDKSPVRRLLRRMPHREKEEKTKSNGEYKRKWKISISSLISSTVKIDLDTIQALYPNIEFPQQPDLSHDLSREKRKSIDSKKIVERKISVETEKPLYESQTSTGSTNQESEDNSNIIAFNRKISIVDDTASKLKPPPSPAKNPLSEVLFITNLVRPFTIKQLKELLERTGTIRENGFWTDKIKSKCYVFYETVEEAEATRNALHGVQWPIGNGKQLIIDYATPEDLENAMKPPVVTPIAPSEPEPKIENENKPAEKPKVDDKLSPKEEVKRKSDGPIREWDIGKKDFYREKSRSRERERGENDRRKHRRSSTPKDDYIKKKQKKLEENTPQKLMDDLFLKTKASPSIYWQPLSPEEIQMKQQQRLIRMEEHKRRIEENSRFRGRDSGRGPPSFRRRYD